MIPFPSCTSPTAVPGVFIPPCRHAFGVDRSASRLADAWPCRYTVHAFCLWRQHWPALNNFAAFKWHATAAHVFFSMPPLKRHTAHAPHRLNRLIQALGTGSMLLSQACYPSTLLFRIRIPFLCQVGYPHEEVGFALAGVLHACYSILLSCSPLKVEPSSVPEETDLLICWCLLNMDPEWTSPEWC